MILPIGDEPNPRAYVPWVNYLLITVNILVFVAISLPLQSRSIALNHPGVQELLRGLIAENPHADPWVLAESLRAHLSAYDLLLMSWGYRPAQPALLPLLTSLFLHGGWMHLLGNMLFLWIYGDNVEHRLGRLAYLGSYLLCGVTATLSYAAFVPQHASHIPLVGASGAISGALGCYFLWFPRNRVRLLVLFFPFFLDVWKVNARLVLGFYLLIENLLPFLVAGGDSKGGVAHGAHIGGFVTGLSLAFIVQRVERFLDQRTLAASTAPAVETSHPKPNAEHQVGELAELDRAYRAGELDRAAQLFCRLPRGLAAEVSPALLADLGDFLRAGDQPALALALYRRATLLHPNGPQLDRLFLGLGLVLLHHRQLPTAAYQALLDALDANPSPAVEAEARQALAVISADQKLRFS